MTSSLAPLLLAAGLFAQADRDTVYLLPPVLVTPTQARERSTPATFSNLDRRDLALRYSTQDVPLLLAELPSITTYSENGNGIGYNYVTLRGFDQRRISVLINGVPQNDPEDHNVYWIDFPDLLAATQSVQVQRGAGSAFYGPPAIGGSINLVANPFQAEPSLKLESLFGFQEFGGADRRTPLASRKLSAEFNSGPVSDRYMFYGRLGRITSEGYRENAYARLGSYFFGGLRRDGNMVTRVHLFGGLIGDGLAYTGLPKFVNGDRDLRRQNLADWGLDSTESAYSYAIPRRTEEVEQFSQPHYELLHSWTLRPGVTLSNTFFYYTGDGYFDYDASWADTSMLRLGTAYGIPASTNPTNTLVRAFVANRQGGWLPRVDITHPNGTLTLGAEARVHRSTHWGRIQFAGDLPPTMPADYHFYEYRGEKDILSFYAHELLAPTQRLTVMGDLQVVRNRYGIEREKFLGNEFSLPYVFVNPRLGVNVNPSEALNLYAALAYTSREPRLRNLYAAEDSYFGATPQFEADTSGGGVRYHFSRPLAKPEHLLDAELGGRWGQGPWSGGISAFWMEFADELIKSGQVDIFGQPVTGNADRSRHAGVELELGVTAAKGLSLTANVALSRNRLVRYRTLDDSGSLVSLDGNPIAGFPDVLGNLRLTWRRPSFALSWLTRYVGAFPTDNFDDSRHRNDAYSVSDLTALYSAPAVAGVAFDVRGEIRNVFDALYTANGEGAAFFPAAERNYLVGLAIRL